MSNLLKIAGKIVLAGVLFFVLTAMASFPIVFIGLLQVDGSIDRAVFGDWLSGGTTMLRLLLIAQTLSMIVAVWIMWRLFERSGGWSLGWQQARRFRAAGVGALWGIALMTACFCAIWLAGGVEIIGFGGADALPDLAYAIVLFALVAVGEELFNRGYVQGLLRRRYGAATAIAATSLIFAVMHLMNDSILQSPVPIVNLMLAGVLLGVAREATGGLWVPIGIHFTWNLFQGNVYGFEVSGLDAGVPLIVTEASGSGLLSGGGFGAEGSLLGTAVIAVFTGLLLYVYRRRKGKGGHPQQA